MVIRHWCVILHFVASFGLLGILGVGCQLWGHCVFNFVLITWEDTVVSVGIVRWSHRFDACSLEETYWTYFELDHFLISNIRQVIVLHTKSFTISVRRCLKATWQKTAIAKNRVFRRHGWTGYLSVPASLLGRCWAHIMPRWMMARTSQSLCFLNTLPTWCVRIPLRRYSVLLFWSFWYEVVLFKWLNSWHRGRRRAILSLLWVFLHIYLLDMWWIVSFWDRRDSLVSVRIYIGMICEDSRWVHCCHRNFSIICATVSVS